MPMNLHDEISAFLEENGITHDIVAINSHNVVLAHTHSGKNIPIIPVQITSTNPQEAGKNASMLSACIDATTLKTGERPLVIAEDRWRRQGKTIRTRLLSHLEIYSQVYARNCEVRKIDRQTAADFLNTHHSYGDAACRYRYGLYLKRHTGHNAEDRRHIGELIAVATFSNARKWIKGDKTILSYEWTRYASLPDLRISGGMGRLMKAFINEVKPDDIMSYADLEWSDGKVYEALRFRLEEVKEPVWFVVDGSWKRLPVKQGTTDCQSLTAETDNLYFKNLGSNKYRLKLTDYQ